MRSNIPEPGVIQSQQQPHNGRQSATGNNPTWLGIGPHHENGENTFGQGSPSMGMQQRRTSRTARPTRTYQPPNCPPPPSPGFHGATAQAPEAPSSSDISTPRKVGNNRFGATGTTKCFLCRERKAKCEYDPDQPLEACKLCKSKDAAATCGEKITAEEFNRQKEKKALAKNDNSFGQSKWEDVRSGKYSDFTLWVESQQPAKNFEEMAMLAQRMWTELRQDQNLTLEAALQSCLNILHPDVSSPELSNDDPPPSSMPGPIKEERQPSPDLEDDYLWDAPRHYPDTV